MEIDDLKSLAGRKKIPQGIIYKDYVITAILEKISEKSYSNKFIFKGGTCLKKIYFEETRFSVLEEQNPSSPSGCIPQDDIDFTCLEESVIDEMITDLKAELEDTAFRGKQTEPSLRSGRGMNPQERISCSHSAGVHRDVVMCENTPSTSPLSLTPTFNL